MDCAISYSFEIDNLGRGKTKSCKNYKMKNNQTKKELQYYQDRHEALKILIEMADPEIWLPHAEHQIMFRLDRSPRSARKMVKYWVKRWGFKTNTKWDSGIRGLWSLRPILDTPLIHIKELKGKVIANSEEGRFRFSVPTGIGIHTSPINRKLTIKSRFFAWIRRIFDL